MRVDVLSLFPAAFTGPLDVSIIQRARDDGLLALHVHDIRDHATDRHRSVDDYPFGGGQGMVLRVDVLDRALAQVRGLAPEPGYVIYLTPQGERLTDRLVRELAKEPRLILVCGRYEGVDDRFVEHRVDREVSIGDYILTGGELPAMVLIDAVARHIPGALGDEASSEDESFATGLLEHPQYTRPAEYEGWEVPPVLLGGDHAAIERWKQEQRLLRTALRRPDLLPPAVGRAPVKAPGAKLRTYLHPDDFDAVAALWRDVGEAGQPNTAAEFAAIERKLTRDPDLFVVAQSGRRMVGAALAGWDGHTGYLYRLAIAPDHRRKGLATALLQELEARLVLKGCTRLLAALPAADPTAKAFFAARGWARGAPVVFAKALPTGRESWERSTTD
jgi:tRNA (guanine37-N1)-methyltransferase